MLARDSLILGSASSRSSVSHDSGQTWSHAGLRGFTAWHWGSNPGTTGALLGARSYLFYRSDDLGVTYTELGAPLGDVTGIAEVPPSAALPEGRVLVSLYNGLALSSDGGVTFEPSGLYEPGRLLGHGVAFAPEPGHPYGGAAYAVVGVPRTSAQGFDQVVFRSDDGGAAWGEVVRAGVGDYGLSSPNWSVILAGPDGSVWVGILDLTGPHPGSGVILVSRDGGASFAEASEGWGGYAPRDLALAPDGRVYVATDSLVWRTTGSVIATSTSRPPEASGAALRVSPNPAAGAVRITLTLPSPEAVTLTVFDARGREAAQVASDARGAGEHAFEVDTEAWAAGVYSVRAEVGGEVVSARFTLVR